MCMGRYAGFMQISAISYKGFEVSKIQVSRETDPRISLSGPQRVSCAVHSTEVTQPVLV